MKVGEYVRTPNGVITKIIDIQDEEGQYFIGGNAVSLNSKQYIADKNITIGENFNHSPNIIDLIEENDYINGLRVEKNKYGELYTSYVYYGGDIGKQSEVYTTWLKDYKENEDWIETIVTKEQFEAMEYKCE